MRIFVDYERSVIELNFFHFRFLSSFSLPHMIFILLFSLSLERVGVCQHFLLLCFFPGVGVYIFFWWCLSMMGYVSWFYFELLVAEGGSILR